jgi:acyl-CoA dehydrogenase
MFWRKIDLGRGIVNFDLSEEQNMLREQAARIFEELAAPERLRALLNERAPYDPSLWGSLSELGFLGAALPEAYGGLGMSPLDLAMLMEEAGRACAAVPLFSSICLAAEAISLAGTEAQKTEWLPRLASGEVIGTFAHVEGPGPVLDACVATQFSDGRLTGTKFPVPDGQIAQVAVIAAVDADGRPVLTLLELAQDGVLLQDVPGMDELRHHARLTLNGARADLMCAGEAAAAALGKLYDRAAVYAAFEQLGGAERALFMARDYALDRKVFSRPIGSFQSIKHRLADMLCLVEVARSNAWYAAWALVNDPEGARAAAAVARISATEAYEFASRENVQIHGGIGYTWEADCHFYYRRSRLLAVSLGSVAEWSDRLVAAMQTPSKAA